MMKCSKNVMTIAFLFVCAALFAQDKDFEREKIKQLEDQKKEERQRMIHEVLDSAIYLMENEAYAEADVKFKYVLKNIKSVPSDFTYYFGKNSYFIGQYKQSIDWLNKYIQLKGTSGKFSEDAVTWMRKSENKILEERQVQTQQAQEILSRDFDIDCGPSGKVTCPVCNGSTVIVKKGYLGETYKPCGYCHTTGYLSCEEYNKLLRGELKAN